MGLNNKVYYAIDYMLETMFLGFYLLFIFIYYLSKIDVGCAFKNLSNYLNFNIISQNNNKPVIASSSYSLLQ